MADEPIQVETLPPSNSLQPAFQPDPKLDEAQVRAAMKSAADAGVDPFKLTMDDLNAPIKAPAPVEIPEKFRKPNGEADVEKLNASTKQLAEAIQVKEQKIQEVTKTVEDLFKEYKVLEAKNSSLPNPEKLAAQLPPPPPVVPQTPQSLSDAQLEAMINADIAQNPARTMAQFVQIQVQKVLSDRLQPIESERKDNQIRENIRKIAETDPRILNQAAFDAVNAELRENPELWNLKNPHKVAWLEVKEKLRLGELTPAQAQPSKPVAPILGGGTPPPAPSLSDARTTAETLGAAINHLSFDPRNGKIDKNQQKALDDAAAEYFRNATRISR